MLLCPSRKICEKHIHEHEDDWKHGDEWTKCPHAVPHEELDKCITEPCKGYYNTREPDYQKVCCQEEIIVYVKEAINED